MKCNLKCPYAKDNGENLHKNCRDIICEARRWYMTDNDDCIQRYDEKTIQDLRRIFGMEEMQ